MNLGTGVGYKYFKKGNRQLKLPHEVTVSKKESKKRQDVNLFINFLITKCRTRSFEKQTKTILFSTY